MFGRQIGLKAIYSYPFTWLALLTVLGIVGGIFSWFQPPMVIKLSVAGGGVVLFILWTVIFTRSDVLYQQFMEASNQWLPEELERHKLLEADLLSLGSEQGAAQLRRLREKLDSLTEVLRRKLSAGELTYGRYLGTAEQVYLSAIDNLRDVAVALKSVSTIDLDYINKRLKELNKSGQEPKESAKEVATLEKRRSLLEEQGKKVAELVGQNESAMTALDNTATALADTKTGKGDAEVDAETAMAELEELAKRAQKYSSA